MTGWMDDDLEERRRRGLYRRRRVPESGQGPRLVLGGRELVNFSSNDYLNLASDPRLARAAARAARRYGCGAGASALVSGWLPPLRRLERELADWQGAEAALVFASGFAANLAVVSSLAGPGDAVFSDALNHASLIDGCRLSRAAVHVYRHGDAGHLEELLRQHGPAARRRVIVTDSVFSMDGDAAPLAEIAGLARRYEVVLVVDEAHATGVLGEGGRGLAAGLGGGDGLVKVGTLSKALGAQGGFVCGSARLVEWLVNVARPYIFSTALAPPVAAAARAGVRVAAAEAWRREHVLQLAGRLREGIAGLGYPPTASCSPVVPVIVGEPAEAVRLSERLAEAGLLVPAIRPPAVPPGTSRLRVSVTAGLTDEDVGRLVESLRR